MFSVVDEKRPGGNGTRASGDGGFDVGETARSARCNERNGARRGRGLDERQVHSAHRAVTIDGIHENLAGTSIHRLLQEVDPVSAVGLAGGRGVKLVLSEEILLDV